jgi:hypothetical protein
MGVRDWKVCRVWRRLRARSETGKDVESYQYFAEKQDGQKRGGGALSAPLWL